MQQQPALGAIESELHRQLTSLTQEVLAGAQKLRSYDGTVPRSIAKPLEDQLQQQLRKLKSLLADLIHAANEQERWGSTLL